MKGAMNAKILVQNDIKEVEIRCHNGDFHKSRIDKIPAIEKFFREDFTTSGIAHWGKVGNSQSWWISTKDIMERLDILYKKNKTIYKI